MALLGVNRTLDIGPWRGWEITNHGEAATLGPIASPVGQVVVSIDGGILTLATSAQRLLVTNIRGSISQLHFSERMISLVIPPLFGAEGAFLHFTAVKPKNILSLLVDGQPGIYSLLDDGTVLTDLPGSSTPIEIVLFYRATTY